MSIISESNEDFIIVTNQKTLYLFFSELYGQNKLIFNEPFKLKGVKRLFFYLPYFYKYRKKLWSKFKKIKNSKIYFFFNAFGYIESWILLRLSKKNELFYKPDVDTSFLRETQTLKTVINKWKIFLLYKVKVNPIANNERIYYSVSKKFIERTNTKIIEYKINVSVINEILYQKFKITSKEILFLTGGLIDFKLVYPNEFVIKNDKLLSSLNNKGVIIKPHPRFNKLYSLENKYELIPDYIPANLLFYKFKVVIGYATSVLFESANNGCLSISLLEYFNPISESQKDLYINYLTSNLNENNKIYFPKTVEEIMDLIK